MTKPFAGIRILDFTRVLAGPYGTYQFGLMGADVIKIESKDGDDMRYGGVAKEWSARGMAPGWMAVNANKRSITLDLKKPEAIAVVKKLVETADIVWENFRPGVMDGLGIGYKALSAINPKLIYCAVSGFGQTGPESKAAAFDGMVQAMSGLMSITGHPEMGPTRVGYPACDVTAGATAAFGVASALFQRTHTGKGQLVDIAMLDSTMAFIGTSIAEYTFTGKRPPQAANQSVTRKPTGDMFPTKDGFLVLAVMTDKQFGNLMREIGRPDIADDPGFGDWDKRIARSAEVKAIITEALKADTSTSWAQRLRKADAPCGKVYAIDEIMAHPQLDHRTIVQKFDTQYGPVTLAGSGVKLEHGGPSVERAPPALGQHTEEVLKEAGYDAAGIASLKAAGAV